LIAEWERKVRDKNDSGLFIKVLVAMGIAVLVALVVGASILTPQSPTHSLRSWILEK
jgi:hypothetical protein